MATFKKLVKSNFLTKQFNGQSSKVDFNATVGIFLTTSQINLEEI